MGWGDSTSWKAPAAKVKAKAKSASKKAAAKTAFVRGFGWTTSLGAAADCCSPPRSASSCPQAQQERWTCNACGEANREDRTACNCCWTHRPEQSSAPRDPGLATTPTAKATGKPTVEERGEKEEVGGAKAKRRAKFGFRREEAEDDGRSRSRGGVPSASLETVLAALETIRYPNKQAVLEHFQKLGHQHAKKLPSYKFVPHSGLSSHHVQYVTDADLIFNNNENCSVVTPAIFDALLQIANAMCVGSVYAAKVCKNEEELYDADVSDSDKAMLRDLVAQNAVDAVTFTGTCKTKGGWWVPVDFTAQCGEARMSKERRIRRIVDNLEEGNFAKVASRLRALFSSAERAKFAAAWNESVGALRFLVKQLEVVRRMPLDQQSGYLAYLELPGHVPDEWARVAEAEMQRRALELLHSWKEQRRLHPALGVEADRVLALLGPSMQGRASGASEQKSKSADGRHWPTAGQPSPSSSESASDAPPPPPPTETTTRGGQASDGVPGGEGAGEAKKTGGGGAEVTEGRETPAEAPAPAPPRGAKGAAAKGGGGSEGGAPPAPQEAAAGSGTGAKAAGEKGGNNWDFFSSDDEIAQDVAQRQFLMEKRWLNGKVVKLIKEQDFGFIKVHGEAGEKRDVFFRFDRVSGHARFPVQPGDQVRFMLQPKRDDKWQSEKTQGKGDRLTAAVVEVLHCAPVLDGHTRRAIDEYVQSLERSLASNGEVYQRALLDVNSARGAFWGLVTEAALGSRGLLLLALKLVTQIQADGAGGSGGACTAAIHVMLGALVESRRRQPDDSAHVAKLADALFGDSMGPAWSLLVLGPFLERAARTSPVDLHRSGLLGAIRCTFDKLPLTEAMRKYCALLDKTLDAVLGCLAAGDGGAPDIRIHWRFLQRVPTVAELEKPEPWGRSFLPKVQDAYESFDMYMSTQVELLREDCFAALREGVHKFVARGESDFRDLKLYTPKIVGVHCGETAVSLAIQVQPLLGSRSSGSRQHTWWKGSSLMFGNLLCLSLNGSFDDDPLIFATVVESSPEELQKTGVFLAEVSSCLGKRSIVQDSAGFAQSVCEIIQEALAGRARNAVLAESPTYFRAYGPVLQCLQENFSTEADLAFPSEVLNGKLAPVYDRAPSYLMDATINVDRVFTQELPPKMQSLRRCTLSGSGGACNVGDVTEALVQGLGCSHFDGFQLNAVRHVLQHRVAIVQGAPGTGKSYIGVELVRLLDSAKPDRCPEDAEHLNLKFLLLTYKNHALDEFLVDLLPHFPGKVLRVGSRSENPALENCNLSFLKREARRARDAAYLDEKRNLDTEMQDARERVQKVIDNFSHAWSFTPVTFLYSATPEQLEHFIRGTDWTKVRWGKKKGPAGARVDALLRKAAQYVHEEGESDSGEPYSLQTFLTAAEVSLGAESDRNELRQLVVKAVEAWLPPAAEFEKLEKSVLTRQAARGAASSSTLQSVKAAVDAARAAKSIGKPGEDDDSDDEEARELEQERLAGLVFDMPGKGKGKGKGKSLSERIMSLKHASGTTGGPSSTRSRGVQFSREVAAQVGKADKAALLLVTDVWGMDTTTRCILVQLSLEEQVRHAKEQLDEAIRDFEGIAAKKRLVEDAQTVQILEQHKVVGMTLTGAALNQNAVRQWRPDVVIVEEAAEVNEPHLVATFGPHVKHLILVGDHWQLPPAVESFNLKENHGFGVSLMERLIRQSFPYAPLRTQSRSLPTISKYLRLRYDDMEDNLAIVGKLSRCQALCKDFFWWDTGRAFPEQEGRSPANLEEARRCIFLAYYLLKEGVSCDKITLLAPYQGQVFLLRKLLREGHKGGPGRELPGLANFLAELKGLQKKSMPKPDTGKREADGDDGTKEEETIRVQPLDRFQGDQNDYIIASMTRSNKEYKAGFLKAKEGLNRRVVLQSRARVNLCLVGDAENFESDCRKRSTELCPNEAWAEFIKALRNDGCCGPSIRLSCPRHPHKVFECSSAEGLPLIGQALCGEKCPNIMRCGHACRFKCHSGPCPQHLCEEKVWHPCPKAPLQHPKLESMCKDDPAKLKCLARETFRCKSCSGPLERFCWEADEDIKCEQIVSYNCLAKAHMLKRRCCDEEEACTQEVLFPCPRCSHTLRRKCHQKESDIRCEKPCSQILPCGHSCPKLCGQRCPTSPEACPQCKEEKRIREKREKEEHQQAIERKKSQMWEELERFRGRVERASSLSWKLRPGEEDFKIGWEAVKTVLKAEGFVGEPNELHKLTVSDHVEEANMKGQQDLLDPTVLPRKYLFMFRKAGTFPEPFQSLLENGFELQKGSKCITLQTDADKKFAFLCDVWTGKLFHPRGSPKKWREISWSKLRSAHNCDSVVIEAEDDGNAPKEVCVFDPRLIVPRFFVSFSSLRRGGCALPAYWVSTASTEKPWSIIHLREDSDEFKTLRWIVRPEGSLNGRDLKERVDYSSFELSRAWRLEHPELWKKYVAEKESLRNNDLPNLKRNGLKMVPLKVRGALYHAYKHLPAELEEDLNEVFLTHGTKPETALLILNNGMNERYCSLGGLFGGGVYFAEDVAKNNQYVQPDPRFDSRSALHRCLFEHVKHPDTEICYVFVCRVLGGFYQTTKKGENQRRETSPVRGTNPPINHHLLLAETGSGSIIHLHREFIQYHSSRVYPEYLLAYRRC